MDIDPCKVCGGTEVNLVDGYKYCVECGTQNEHFKETVIDYQVLEDNTVLFKTKKVIIKPELVKENVDEEWLKWHTFNFILTGIIDEVISLGAKSSVKTKLLWIWKRYVTKYRVKKDQDEDDDKSTQDTDEEAEFLTNTQDGSQENQNKTQKSQYIRCQQKGGVITISVLYTLIYMALNFDRDEIQASDLIRYIREGRLSYKKCIQLIPKGLDYRKIRQWITFANSTKNFFTLNHLRCYAFFIIKDLDLGAPVTPNMIKLCDRYVKELALPKDLMTFILCLISVVPPYNKDLTSDILRWPQYEEKAMSYIIVSMKLLFGLDDLYEYHLDIMSKDVNQCNAYEKLFKSNLLFEKSQRSFIWQDWMKFITYRKICLSKFCYPIAFQENALSIDAQLFISHYNNDLEEYKCNMDYSSQLTLQVLQKLSNNNKQFTTPRLSFPPSLTPMSTYTEVLLNSKWIKELNIDIISEDFCSYSLNHIFGECLSNGRPLENKVIAENGLVKDHVFGGLKIDSTEQIVNFNKIIDVNETIDQGTNNKNQNISDTLSCDVTLQATINVNLRDEIEIAASQNDNDDILSTRSEDSHTRILQDNPLMPALNSELNRDNIIRGILDVYLEKYQLRKPQPRKRTKDDFIIYNPNFKRDRKTPTVPRGNPAVTRRNVDNILSDYFSRLQNLGSNSYTTCDTDHNFRLNDKENKNTTNLNMQENLDACDTTEVDVDSQINYEPLNENMTSISFERNDVLNSANNAVKDNSINNETDHLNEETKDEIDEMDIYMDLSDDEIPDIDFSRFEISRKTLPEILPIETQENLKIDSKDDINVTLKESVNESSQNKMDIDESGVKQDIDDNSSDIPLNVLFQNTLNDSQASTNDCKDKLLPYKCDGEPFVYWIRHYNTKKYHNKMIFPTRFIKELDTFFPANFAWFIKMCTSTIESTNYDLYREIVVLEEKLMVNMPSLRNT